VRVRHQNDSGIGVARNHVLVCEQEAVIASKVSDAKCRAESKVLAVSGGNKRQ
jgi:hypothetical protein